MTDKPQANRERLDDLWKRGLILSAAVAQINVVLDAEYQRGRDDVVEYLEAGSDITDAMDAEERGRKLGMEQGRINELSRWSGSKPDEAAAIRTAAERVVAEAMYPVIGVTVDKGAMEALAAVLRGDKSSE